MLIGTAKIMIYAPWVHSLKEKRMIIKSICAKVKNNFNVSIAELELQDIHQNIVLGIATVVNDKNMADSIIEKVINYIEENTEAEIIKIDKEIR